MTRRSKPQLSSCWRCGCSPAGCRCAPCLSMRSPAVYDRDPLAPPRQTGGVIAVRSTRSARRVGLGSLWFVALVRLIGVGVPMIQTAHRRDALELGWVVGKVGLLQQLANLAVIGRRHVLDLGVGPEGLDATAHVQDSLVQRVTERVTGIAAD